MLDRNFKKKHIGAGIGRFSPPTLDGILVEESELRKNLTELMPGSWFIAKPSNKVPFLIRLYHMYLVLTNKAFAVQYTEDHIRIKNVK